MSNLEIVRALAIVMMFYFSVNLGLFTYRLVSFFKKDKIFFIDQLIFNESVSGFFKYVFYTGLTVLFLTLIK